MSEKDNQFLCHLYLLSLLLNQRSSENTAISFFKNVGTNAKKKKRSSQPKAAIFHSYKRKKGIKKLQRTKAGMHIFH